MKSTPKIGGKIIIGFVLALTLVISLSTITYISVKRLLSTVEELSAPNERMGELNGLLADIYQLDRIKSGNFGQDSTTEIEGLQKIERRINLLLGSAADTAEISGLNKIGLNVNELISVYTNLQEVKYNLANRNFSEEALRNIELKIKRQEEVNRLSPLGRLRAKTYQIGEISVPDSLMGKKSDSLKKKPSSVPSISSQERDKILGFLRNFEKNDTSKVDMPLDQAGVDAILKGLKGVVTDIYRDEQRLRQDLATLESTLLDKNREIFSSIQELISSMQEDILYDSRQKNNSAYQLTYNVSLLLAFFVILGTIGSAGFIYNILKEIGQANTYRKQLEEAKLRSDQLAKAKQDFLANMSHEIRNPLHAIQGYQAALEKSGVQEEQKEFVKMIGFASDTLISIVNDILDFSKLEAGKIQIESEPFDGKHLFLSIKSFFALKAEEKKLGFNWDISLPENKWLVGDKLRINQILNNLLSNALKFTQSGEVNVVVKYLSGGAMLLQVQDTGMGMSEEVKNNIFKEFNQGDSSVSRRFGGTGLGLSIVKRLVELQEGNISVESQIQVGTTITIQIPCQLAAPLNTEKVVNKVWYSLKGVKILLIDDDPIGIKFAKLLLESNGAEVVTYLGGLAYTENFEEQHFDMAILDIQMPQVSGYQVLRMLKSNPKYEQMPTMAITANVFAEDREKLSDAGFDAMVLKPFNEDELIPKIGELLGLKAYSDVAVESPVVHKTTKVNDAVLDFDVSDLKGFCMGDEAMLYELLQDFYEETTSNLLEVERSLEKGDFTRIMEIAHQLSSRLGQLKFSCAHLAKNIELDIKTGKMERIEEKTMTMMQETKLILEKVSHEMGLKSLT